MTATNRASLIGGALALIAGALLACTQAQAQMPGVAVHLPVSSATLPVVAPSNPPAYVADLTTPAAMNAFNAQWRNMDAWITEVPAMPGAPAPWKKSFDLEPKAGPADFNDSAWPVIEPKGLTDHRGGGYMYMTWFRTTLTVPAKIGDFDPSGARAALNITVDDYAEVWINGQLPRAVGRPSPATIQGFNMPNRVMLSESLKPGDKFQIAILAINGSLSSPPANAVFFRGAEVDFYK